MKMTNYGSMPRLSGLGGLLIILTVFFAASQAFAFFGGKITEFSADQVFIDETGKVQTTTKVYVSEGKYRMDGMPGPTDRTTDIAVISFKDEQRMIMINNEKKLYYDGVVSDNMAGIEKQIKASQAKGKVLGTETVSGLKCTKKEVESVFEMMGYKKVSKQIVWVSDRLEMPVRTQTEGGHIGELRNIKKGKQKASLFEAPKGYQKVSSMMAVMGMDFGRMGRDGAASDDNNSPQGGSQGSGFTIPKSLKDFKLPFGKKE